MKKLNKVQSIVYMIGGLLMVAGAGASVFGWAGAPYIYAIGAVAFTSMQLMQTYEGNNLTIRRLRRILVVSDILFLLTAVLMFAARGNIFGLSQIVYVQYVYNKWIGMLLLAAIIQIYAIHRLDYELGKEAKKR
jgi:hypothetical protein